eukprot:Seg164.8 transcript_id=Seg164.8/GoldUCD/mRNA.D3Y31 product="Ancient ubiquitous protein 1" protein_id=Seg164.8/GoldUCD/D3Y31
MAPAGIEDVFNVNRLPNGASLLLLLLYSPLGVFICLFRLLFCVQLGIILSLLPKGSIVRQLILRICGYILGVAISVQNRENSSSRSKILVSNNISELDCLALEAIEPHVLVSRSPKLPFFVNWLLGYHDFGNSAAEMTQNVNEYFQNADTKIPLLVLPEESTTNGKISLLKFSLWPFQFNKEYQPVLLKARRPPILNVNLSTLDSGFWSDLFWMFFLPYTIYEIRYLDVMKKQETAPNEEFAKSVNKEMSNALNLQQSQFDIRDKSEYIKKLKHAQREIFQQRQQTTHQIISSNTANSISKLDRMVKQVKDVLPQVPKDAIRKDLMTSKSVDLTLTNILEGRVSYVPLTNEESEAEKRQQIENEKNTGKSKTSIRSTNISNTNIGLSFHERKGNMIEEARRLYLEKHPEYED